jgi:hypothetical protein
MTQVRWPKGRATFYKRVKQHADLLANGRVLCIDPATGSTSQPGWALYVGGRCVRSGVLNLPGRAPVADRLRALRTQLQALDPGALDVLVLEELRGSMVHAHLHWAAGVVAEALHAEVLLEIPIPVWKAVAAADPRYTKGDEADARAFGEALVALARGSAPERGTAATRGWKRTKRGRTGRASGVRNAKRVDTRRMGGSKCRR